MKSLDVLDINLEKNEMLLQVDHGSKVSAQVVKFYQITKIECKDQKVRKWFRTTNIKVVEIFLKGKGHSLLLRSDKLKAPFDSTVSYLLKFAKQQNVLVLE